MAVNLKVFLSLGMFDETFTNVGWDTEFCIRAYKSGYSTVYTPYASAYMKEKPFDYRGAPEKNLERCRDVYREFFLTGDPFYSVNYDYRYKEPQLAIKPGPPAKYGLVRH